MPLRPRRLAPLLSFSLILATSAAADGPPDPTFGGGDGLVFFPGGTDSFELADVATGDDLLVAVGKYQPSSGPPTHLSWQAVNPQGTTLSSHACRQTTGSLVPFGTSSNLETALVDSTGNLLVGGAISFLGTESFDNPFLARFALDVNGCELDTSFADNGWNLYSNAGACDPESCRVTALGEILPATGAVATPRIVALVRAEDGFVTSRYLLVRLLSNGSIDGSFGSGGWAEVTAPGLGEIAVASAMAIDGQGRILVLVTRWDPALAGDLDAVLLRFTAAGALDWVGTFTPWLNVHDAGDDDDTANPLSGTLEVAANGDLFASYLLDGRVVWKWDFAASQSHRVSFGNGGSVQLRLAVQGDGWALATADNQTTDDFFSRRFSFANDQFTNDPNWGTGGIQTFEVDLGGTDAETVSDLVLWHGRPVFAGTAATTGGRTVGFFLRAENAHVFADSFDQGTLARWPAATP